MPTEAQQSEIRLSLIIVTWNNEATIGRCLASIYAHRPAIPFEVVLVDNMSEDGTCRIVQQDFPQVRLIQAGENGGFARGNNLGFAAAAGDLILMLNPDAYLEYGWPEQMLDYIAAHREVGAMGCVLLDEDAVPTFSYDSTSSLVALSYIFTLFKIIVVIIRALRRKQSPAGLIEVGYVVGAFLLTRRDVVERLGFLDDKYFAYFEEVDLCRRIAKAGLKILHDPLFKIIHPGSQSFARMADRGRAIFIRSICRYFEKNCGLVGRLAHRALILRCALKLRLYQAVCFLFPTEFHKRGVRKYRSLLQACKAGETRP